MASYHWIRDKTCDEALKQAHIYNSQLIGVRLSRSPLYSRQMEDGLSFVFNSTDRKFSLAHWTHYRTGILTLLATSPG